MTSVWEMTEILMCDTQGAERDTYLLNFSGFLRWKSTCAGPGCKNDDLVRSELEARASDG